MTLLSHEQPHRLCPHADKERSRGMVSLCCDFDVWFIYPAWSLCVCSPAAGQPVLLGNLPPHSCLALATLASGWLPWKPSGLPNAFIFIVIRNIILEELHLTMSTIDGIDKHRSMNSVQYISLNTQIRTTIRSVFSGLPAYDS